MAMEAKNLVLKKNIRDDFVLGETIGEGCSSVRYCRSKATGASFACKSIRKSARYYDEGSILSEIQVLKSLSGVVEGVVGFQAAYEDEGSYHIVMELVSDGRNLYDLLAQHGRPFSERKSASIVRELMLIIKGCHEERVIHRDIKLENIMMVDHTPASSSSSSSGVVKLVDFGLAVKLKQGENAYGCVGTYVAPEAFVDCYTQKFDIWGAGVVLHALLIRALPFDLLDSMDQEMYDEIQNADLTFEDGVWQSISPPARDLLRGMLCRDPSLRLSADQVLGHPWILAHTKHTSRKKKQPLSAPIAPRNEKRRLCPASS